MIYILATFFILIFTKEFLPINQELLVIISFLIMFFLIKQLIQRAVVNNLKDYRNEIKTIYLDSINKQVSNSRSKIMGLIDRYEELHYTAHYIQNIEKKIGEILRASGKTIFKNNVNNLIQDMVKHATPMPRYIKKKAPKIYDQEYPSK